MMFKRILIISFLILPSLLIAKESKENRTIFQEIIIPQESLPFNENESHNSMRYFIFHEHGVLIDESRKVWGVINNSNETDAILKQKELLRSAIEDVKYITSEYFKSINILIMKDSGNTFKLDIDDYQKHHRRLITYGEFLIKKLDNLEKNLGTSERDNIFVSL